MAFKDVPDTGKVTMMKYDSIFVGMASRSLEQVRIFPNPARETIAIDLPFSGGAEQEINIYNIAGMQVLSLQSRQKSITVDIRNLPAGVYFVRISGSSLVCTGKFSKM